MTRHSTRRHHAVLLPILLGGFLLRLYQLGAQSLWYDETVSAFLAARAPAALIAHTARDIHPPFYYLLLHFWTRLVGDSEFALAFASVIWGMLLIVLTYQIARRLIDTPTGLLAAALVAISPYNIWYSQEVRMYTMGSFLGLLTLDGLIRLWGDPRASLSWLTGQGAQGRQGAATPWLIWVLAAVAGLYTLYYFAFLLVAENAFAIGYWWWRRRQEGRVVDRLLWRWLGVQVATILLYLPWLPVAYRQATDPPVPPWRSFTGIWDVLRDSWSALVLGQSVKPEQVWPLLVIAVAIYLLALWPAPAPTAAGRSLKTNLIRLLLAGYTFAPLAIIFLISYIVPLYHVRYVFLYGATFYIVLAWGVRRLWGFARPAWRAVLVGVIVVAYSVAAGFSLFQFWTNPLYAADDYRAGVRYIARHLGPDDAVLINAGYVYTAFRYYYRGPIAWQGRLTDYPEEGVSGNQGAVIVQTGTVDGPPNLGWGHPEADFYAMPWGDTRAALERLFRHHPRVWMLRAYDTVSDPEGRIRAWLNEHGLLFDDQLLTGETNARVQGWRNHKQAWLIGRSPQYPVGVYFGQNVLQLQGYNLPSTEVAAGQDLLVVLHWQRWAKPGTSEGQIDYSVSVGLFDVLGHRWAQLDEKPGAPLYPTSAWALAEVMEQPVRLPVPLGVPPGDYFLDVTVYDAASAAVLAVTDPIWGVEGTRARLGQVTVTRPDAWPEAAWPELLHRAAAGFGKQVRLVRYEMPVGEFRPGQSVNTRLLWQATQTSTEDNQIVLALLDKGGQPVVTSVQPPAGGLYPMPEWLPGEVVLDAPTLLIPGRVPAGRYRLAVAVQAPDGRLLRWRSGLFRRGEYYVLGELSLVAREVNFSIPPITHRVDARLGETIRLLGFDLDRTQARPGETLTLTLYWQALGEMAESFKVFNHLVGSDGQLRGQQDGYPAGGTQPTSGWVPNEVIVDRYTLRVADDAPAGTYRLLTGMYRERDLTRLPTFDAGGQPTGDTVPLAEVVITP